MQSVGQKHTGPEMVVRRVAHGLGYRFRLHVSELAGRPDLAFVGRRKAIFVNGCFWHGHGGCSKGRLPKTRLEYWAPKIERNKQRDADSVSQLERDGWAVMTIWQCETRDPEAISVRLRAFLDSPENRSTAKPHRATIRGKRRSDRTRE
jgi:DNA mismatch endonuclease, patch repair protein